MNIQKPRGQSLVGYRPLGIAPSVFGYSLSFFREYFANHLAKLHILLQLAEPPALTGGLVTAGYQDFLAEDLWPDSWPEALPEKYPF